CLVKMDHYRFNHGVKRHGKQNTEKPCNTSPSKNDCNDGERMQGQDTPHNISRDKVAFDLLSNERNERYPNNQHRILKSADNERWDNGDERSKKGDHIHNHGE